MELNSFLIQKLPDGFVCHMEGRTYGSVSLTGPSGKTWTVQLIKQENDLFLHHGWSTFVVDHQLECGELLVFRYEGHLHFTVQVFDKDACEKEAAFHSECSQSSKIMSTNENQELELGVGKELLLYDVVRPISMFRENEETSKTCSANDVPVPFHMENSNEDEGTSNFM